MNLLFRNFRNTLRRYKVASALNILGLSVAFAAFAIILMQVRYDLTYDSSQPEADRIFRIEKEGWTAGQYSLMMPRPMAHAIETEFPEAEAVGLMQPQQDFRFRSAAAPGVDFPFEMYRTIASPGVLDVFNFDWAEGGPERYGEPNTVLICRSDAERIFPGESAVGQHLIEKNLDTVLLRVVGVYHDFPGNATLKNGLYQTTVPDEYDAKWNWSKEVGYVRLNDPAAAEAFARKIAEQYRQGLNGDDSILWRLTPLRETHYVTDTGFDFVEKIDRSRTRLFGLIAVLIVVIAMINFMNFSNALVPARLRAINTQKVFGCADGQIRRMLLFEAVGICGIAAAIAIWLVPAAAKTPVAGLMPAEIGWAANMPLLFGVIGTALAAGLLAGIYPAFHITSFPTALAIKGSVGLSLKGKRLRQVLIGFQYVVSIVLIIVALFIHVQSRYMKQQPMGFERENLLEVKLADNADRGFPLERVEALRTRLLTNPAVKEVGFSVGPVVGLTRSSYGFERENDEIGRLNVRFSNVSLTGTLGIRLIDGRDISPADMLNGRRSEVIINRRAAQEYGLEVGSRIDDQNINIIGIMEDVHYMPLQHAVTPMGFMAAEWSAFSYMYVRLAPGTDPRAAIASILQNTREMGLGDELTTVEFVDRSIARLYEKEDKLALLITLFSVVAIVISLIGIFGLVLFEGRYRRKEIGIRKVHGASVGEILRMMNRNFVRIVVVCFVIAAPIAWYAIKRWLEGFPYKSPVHWWIFAVALLVVGAITVLTVTLQSYRTATETPINAIKTE